jgi:hypothetical protein
MVLVKVQNFHFFLKKKPMCLLAQFPAVVGIAGNQISQAVTKTLVSLLTSI